jgi:hypothetical protein
VGMKHKFPSELNTRQIRVNVGDYLALKELAARLDITIAQSLHLIISEKFKEIVIHIPPEKISTREQREQIPMIPMPNARIRPETITSANTDRVLPKTTKEVS